jgi:8-oxo-dGTP pyrophosphatase MutT (NUDIX family)
MNKYNKYEDMTGNTVLGQNQGQGRPKQYCNNCGNSGHILYQCKMPILSIGIIAFRWNPTGRVYEYLMIRRKDTFGYVDFIRGKYTLDNKEYILRMFRQMTVDEKARIMSDPFDVLWRNLWGKAKTSVQYRAEETGSYMRFRQLVEGTTDKGTTDKGTTEKGTKEGTTEKGTKEGTTEKGTTEKGTKEGTKEGMEKGTIKEGSVKDGSVKDCVLEKGAIDKESGIRYTMADLIAESNLGETWQEQEWGFPKGRRNTQEMDYNCALREMTEETGFPTSMLSNVHNIMPFEETFVGSNNKQYKHRYYLMYMDYEQSLGHGGNYQRDEVSGLDWFSYEDCLARIRPYNVEKREMLRQVHTTITKYGLYI